MKTVTKALDIVQLQIFRWCLTHVQIFRLFHAIAENS